MGKRKNPHAVALAHRGSSKGGEARHLAAWRHGEMNGFLGTNAPLEADINLIGLGVATYYLWY